MSPKKLLLLVKVAPFKAEVTLACGFGQWESPSLSGSLTPLRDLTHANEASDVKSPTVKGGGSSRSPCFQDGPQDSGTVYKTGVEIARPTDYQSYLTRGNLASLIKFSVFSLFIFIIYSFDNKSIMKEYGMWNENQLPRVFTSKIMPVSYFSIFFLNHNKKK